MENFCLLTSATWAETDFFGQSCIPVFLSFPRYHRGLITADTAEGAETYVQR